MIWNTDADTYYMASCVEFWYEIYFNVSLNLNPIDDSPINCFNRACYLHNFIFWITINRQVYPICTTLFQPDLRQTSITVYIQVISKDNYITDNPQMMINWKSCSMWVFWITKVLCIFPKLLPRWSGQSGVNMSETIHTSWAANTIISHVNFLKPITFWL